MEAPKLIALLNLLDLAAVAVFAITGGLVASRKQLDLVGFLWLGVVTGVGGGTLRDLLLDVPVFWVRDATPLAVCLVASVAVYFGAHLVQHRYRVVLWLDGAGLALFAVAGTLKGLDAGAGVLVAIAMGVLTGTAGGVIRDLLGQEPSILLRPEVYVSAALAGAVVLVVLDAAGAARPVAAAAGFITVFGLRALALTFRWSLPVYRSRRGRTYDGSEPKE